MTFPPVAANSLSFLSEASDITLMAGTIIDLYEAPEELTRLPLTGLRMEIRACSSTKYV